jgi:hypothetical protein
MSGGASLKIPNCTIDSILNYHTANPHDVILIHFVRIGTEWRVYYVANEYSRETGTE